MDMRTVNHQVRIQEWREIISEFRNSGKPVREWCAENSIKPGQYYYWLKVVRNDSLALLPLASQTPVGTSQFTSVKISESTDTDVKETGTCAIVKTNSFSIEIKNGANSKTLEHTLQILNGLC